MSTSTTFDFELPEELELTSADQSQPADEAVCDTLADALDDPVAEAEPEIVTDHVDTEGSQTEADEVAVDPPATVVETASTWESRPVNVYYDVNADLLEQIRDAEADCRRSEKQIESLKAQMKEAKGAYEAAVINLRELCSEVATSKQKPRSGYGEIAPVSQPIQYDSAQPVFGGLVNQPEDQSQLTDVADMDLSDGRPASNDNSWRSVPLADIGVSSIQGLGKKKYEALIDLCPTIGAFEDLRGRVGRDAASLPELMPKGIGQAICDHLEEMVLDWLAHSRSVAATPTAAKADPEQLSHEDQVSQRAAELDDGQPNCLACQQEDDGIWKAGYRACEGGAVIGECPWTTGDNQDEWIRGYLAAKEVAGYEGEDEAETEPEAEAAPFDIDSL